jgi:hypothetical protein
LDELILPAGGEDAREPFGFRLRNLKVESSTFLSLPTRVFDISIAILISTVLLPIKTAPQVQSATSMRLIELVVPSAGNIAPLAPREVYLGGRT